jgi:hypothetical protein
MEEARMLVCTYFEPVPQIDRLAERELMAVWKRSWEHHGWQCQTFDESWAREHDRYAEILALARTRPSPCPRDYVVACHLRWLALAVHCRRNAGPVVMSDYDVINVGFTEADAWAYRRPTVIHNGCNPSTVYVPNREAAEAIVEMLSRDTPPRTVADQLHVNDEVIFAERWDPQLGDCDPVTGTLYGHGHETAKLIHFATQVVPPGTTKLAFVRKTMAGLVPAAA